MSTYTTAVNQARTPPFATREALTNARIAAARLRGLGRPDGALEARIELTEKLEAHRDTNA